MPKNLFNDDGENDNIFGGAEDNNTTKPSTFKVNKDFAEKYDQVKRRQELQRLESKLGKNAADDEGEDEEDDEEEYQGPEDDDAELITDEHETEFANLLLKLRHDDPELKNPEVKFFSEIDEEKIRATKQQQKKFTLKDEYQRTIQQDPSKLAEDETSGGKNSEADLRRLKARTSEEKKAKMAFLEADAAVDDKAVTSFTVKKNENNENDDDVDEDERRARKLQKKKKKALEKAFAIEDQDDPEEQFLKLYFRDEKWKDGGDDDENKKSGKKDASGNKAALADWEERMKEEQDEQFYEDAEVWEQEYQQALYRHQEGEEALKVQTFPRQQEEGLLRQKDTARAEARQRKAEREKEQETKLESEVKRLKHLKRQEIESQRERIAKVAGISEAKMKQLAKLLDEELTGGSEFDSSSFDKIMGNLFNEDYYDDVDDKEIHLMEQELEDAYDEEDDEDLPSSDDDDDDDDDNEDAAADSKKSNKKNKEADQNENDEEDDDDLLYPTRFAEKHMEELAEKAREEKKSTTNKKKSKTVFDSDDDLDDEGDKTFSSATDVKKRLKKQLDKKVDEYWKLHYEDVLADGTKTRFKYHEVPRETFGLSDEAVLMTDDRTLNMIAPMNCYAPYLTAEQNKKDRFRSMHRAENMRFLDPDRKTRRYKTNTVAINPDAVDEEGAKKIVEAAHKAAEEAAKANEKNDAIVAANKNSNKTEKTEQKKHHHQQQTQNNNSNNNTHKPKFNNNQGKNNHHQKQNFNNNDKQKFHNKNNNNQQQQHNRESGKRRQRDE